MFDISAFCENKLPVVGPGNLHICWYVLLSWKPGQPAHKPAVDLDFEQCLCADGLVKRIHLIVMVPDPFCIHIDWLGWIQELDQLDKTKLMN